MDAFFVEIKNCVLNLREVDTFNGDAAILSITKEELGKLILFASMITSEEVNCEVKGNRDDVEKFIKFNYKV